MHYLFPLSTTILLLFILSTTASFGSNYISQTKSHFILSSPQKNTLFSRDVCQKQNEVFYRSGRISPSPKMSMANIIHSILMKKISNLISIRSNNTAPAISLHAQGQLLEYINQISSQYHNASYHNFEHAFHVFISTHQLLNILLSNEKITTTYGIKSDPELQLALLFSALIHDVDHPGVPNSQLIIEENELAILYHNESVSEKRSLALAFQLLSQPDYDELRQLLFFRDDEKDYLKFQQIVINLVLSTDIASLKRRQAVMDEWKEAFGEKMKENCEDVTMRNSSMVGRASKYMSVQKFDSNDQARDIHQARQNNPSGRVGYRSRWSYTDACTSNHFAIPTKNHLRLENEKEEVDLLRASAILKLIIQMADVAPLMQSWEIFYKWQKRLFFEQKTAFEDRRGEDPAQTWFENQIAFMDNYILPLIRRMEDCGAFEKNKIDEFIETLEKNKRRWMKEGRVIVEEMTAEWVKTKVVSSQE